MDRPRITYQPALDGLRALAVAAVIAYHLGYPWAQGGFLGVDAFFVLSGFLITSLLLAERGDAGRISLRGFWSRRARRLLPALFLMLTVVCIYAAWNVPALQLGTLRDDALASVFYVANWHFISAGQSYFDLFANPLPFTHLWSLAIEEQFYLLWPLLVLGLVRIGRGRNRALTLFTVGGIVVSQIAMALLYSPDDPTRAYYGTEARAHTILVGCLLALVVRAAPELLRRGGWLLDAAGIAALSLCIVAFDLGRASATYFNGASLGFAVLVAVVIAAVLAPQGLLRRGLSSSVLRFVGRISYGLYLWHWPVIVFVSPDRYDLPTTELNLLRVGLTVVLTVISFRFLEQPILRGRPRITRARALLPVGLAVVLAAVFVSTAGAKSPESVLGRITGGVGRCGAAPAFETRVATQELRRLGGIPERTPAAGRTLAVFGDSRACSLVTGLEVGGADIGAKVGNGAILGCGLVAGAIATYYRMITRSWADGCLHRTVAAVDDVLAHSDPQVVVWYSGWEVNDLALGRRNVLFGSPPARAALLDRLEMLYRHTHRKGRRIVILTVPEEVKADTTLRPDPTSQPRFAVLNGIYREFAARHPADVRVVDLARYVCPKGPPCPVRRDGFRPRPVDGVHFDAKGSAWVAHWLWPRILADWPAPTPARAGSSSASG
ncbi:MAG: acyltransferase family protein [Acidimicrobiia bacterium]